MKPILDIPSGDGYSNWIKVTKQKLKEREHKLMAVRIQSIQTIINTQCQLFENMNTFHCETNNSKHHANPTKLQTMKVLVPDYYKFTVSNKRITDDCLNKLCLILQLWSGINLTKTKKSLATFNRYFDIGKLWFDQKKKTILTPELWIKLFEQLKTFSITAAKIYFQNSHALQNLQSLYSKQLLFLLLIGILDGEIHSEFDIKSRPLISSTIFRHSNPMKNYLINLHHSLNINSLLNKNKHSKKTNASEMGDIIKKQLHYLCQQAHENFKQEFLIKFNLKIRIDRMNNVGGVCTNAFKNNSEHNNNINCSKTVTNTLTTTQMRIRPPTFDVQESKLNKIFDVANNRMDKRQQQLQHKQMKKAKQIYNGYNGVHASVSDNISALGRYNPMTDSNGTYRNIGVLGAMEDTNIYTNVNTNINTNININSTDQPNNDQNAYLQLLQLYLSLIT